VDDLSLVPGRDATALIKSSFVLLSPDANIRISARNRLRGTITSITPGAVNCEVRLQLNGGRIIIAIITNEGLKELDLAEGTECTALIKASHVLVAVSD
jgi:molybdate transport system regulatory protein